MVSELTVDRLRRVLDPRTLPFESSAEAKPLEAIIGQERAVRSLRFGLGIRDLGFNIYVAGLPGTGRTPAVKRLHMEDARDKPVPDDLCYVYNFQDPFRPKALNLRAGSAREFQKDMRILVEDVQTEIRRAFESEEYAAKREESLKGLQQAREEIFSRVNATAQREGFTLQATPVGLATIPVLEGRPLNEQEYQGLPEELKEAIAAKREKLQEEMKIAMRQARALDKSAGKTIQDLDRRVALFAIGHLIEDQKEKYGLVPEVMAYLQEVQDDLLENLSQFRTEPDAQQPQLVGMPSPKETYLKKYEVNVLVDNASVRGKPVVIELNPTYNRLFGRIDREAQFGTLVTDFTLVREGSLHRANGGYLVIPVEELLTNLFSWDSLKRAIRNREIVIEDPGERLGFITTKGIQPEPVPLDVKIVLIGTSFLYHVLYGRDEDFSELFKVKAEFDTAMDRTEANIRDYGSFVCTVCEEEGLKHLDATALARIVEHGSRLADDQDKLSTRFGEISDLIKEANFYASQQGAGRVTEAHVRKAIEEKLHRSNLIAQRIREMILRGTLMVEVTGSKIGQVNGLSVMDLGDISFGRPNRITASIGVGQGGLIDIEREAKLGGPIHSKGVMILSGFLVERFAQDKPLSLSARLVFEQSYSGIDGDSASSTELYAILSRLSGLPIRQGIAVTGSVNQRGEIQAIGGVNEKVEGYFEVCRASGLTGEQGVILPQSNVRNLMLRDELLEAVRQGRFHIWSVKTVDEGIEILTGSEAGVKGETGSFREGTVNYLADMRLRELAEAMKTFRSPEPKDVPDKKKD
ncbi:MAG: ATP-binding protein [bacterium]